MLVEIWASFWKTTQIYKKIRKSTIRTLWLWSWKAPCWIPSEPASFCPSAVTESKTIFRSHLGKHLMSRKSNPCPSGNVLRSTCTYKTRPFLQILGIVEICSLNWKFSTITSFHSGTFKTIHIQDLRKAIGLFLQKVQSPKQVKWMGSNSNPYGILFYGIHICSEN